MKIDLHDALQNILAEHREYRPNAYRFLYLATRPSGGTTHTKHHDASQHLSVRDYYLSVCACALREYGPLALRVFRHWGLHSTQDIANATYYMIEAGLLRKQRNDTREEFLALPSLEQTLEEPFYTHD